MIRVYVGDSLPEERLALRLLLLDLKMKGVGKASDWPITFDLAPLSKPDMLLIDWGMLPLNPKIALAALRAACPGPVVIVLIGYLDARKQAALSSGADALISENETSERVAERIQPAAESISTNALCDMGGRILYSVSEIFYSKQGESQHE